MDYKNIRFELRSNVGTITLNRPEQLNAYTGPMLEEISNALDRLERDGARALILTGAGRAFCAGADLAEMDAIPRETRDMGARLEAVVNPLLERLRALPMPIIAAVNGAAVGAGLGIALSADIVIAGRSAFFLCPFTKIGLVPDLGTTWLLPRLIGKARATAMMLLNERIGAERAESWGLIWQAVDDDQLQPISFGIGDKLANGPTFALARTRSAIHASLESDFSESLALECRNQRECGRSADHFEGITAFLEKREPVYRGR